MVVMMKNLGRVLGKFLTSDPLLATVTNPPPVQAATSPLAIGIVAMAVVETVKGAESAPVTRTNTLKKVEIEMMIAMTVTMARTGTLLVNVTVTLVVSVIQRRIMVGSVKEGGIPTKDPSPLVEVVEMMMTMAALQVDTTMMSVIIVLKALVWSPLNLAANYGTIGKTLTSPLAQSASLA
jgi:hypothetical protein